MAKLTFKNYQRIITDAILAKPRVGVWSFMGSGKTAATLEAIDVLRLAGIGPALVVATKKVAETVWGEEIDKWDDFSHMTYSILCGDKSEREAALNARADVYTVNFENVPWLLERPDRPQFQVIVVDESSKLRGFRGSFQKHPKSGKIYLRRGGTSRASCIAKMAFGNVKRFVELTGTPSTNGLKNLWAQAWFLDGGKRLGNTFSAFVNRWFITNLYSHSVEPKPDAEREIIDRISDIIVSIKPEDFFDLDKPIIRDVFVDLPALAMRAYKSMEKEFYTEIEGIGAGAANKAVSFNKCSQIANGALYTNEGEGRNVVRIHDEKLLALQEIIEESGESPILVAYHYKHDLDRLKKFFSRGVEFDGKLTTVKKWNAGKIPVMFVHPASAGHGLNLQDGGNIIVFFGIDWDLELYAQVIERIGPMRQKQSGHKRNVFVYHILARGTIDEIKLKRIKTKASVQEIITSELAKRRNQASSEQ